MKNIVSVMLIGLMMGVVACSQNNDVPAVVKSGFTNKFPTIKKVEWSKENESEWEAEFKMNNTKYSANFNIDGNWLETEYKIKKSEIPSLVQKTIDNEFSGYEMEAAELSETNEGKVYEFEMEKDKIEMEISIDPMGIVIKKEIIKKDKEE